MSDWDVFREACIAMLNGGNPYSVGSEHLTLHEPAWAMLPLVPLATLPRIAGWLGNAVLSTITIAIVSRRFHLGPWGFFWTAISPMHIQNILYGNIDWLPLLGVLFPSWLALIFYATKPQMTLGFIAITLRHEWKRGGLQTVTFSLVPLLLVAFITIAAWGLPRIAFDNPGNRSIFPLGLFIGLPALFVALCSDDQRAAALVGPFISPYTTFHGYLPALLSLHGWRLAAVSMLSYAPVVMGLVM